MIEQLQHGSAGGGAPVERGLALRRQVAQAEEGARPLELGAPLAAQVAPQHVRLQAHMT